MWRSRYSGWKSVRPFYDERGNGIAGNTWPSSHKTPEISSAQHPSNAHQLSWGCFAPWWNIISGNNSWLKAFLAMWVRVQRTQVLILLMCAILSAIYKPDHFSVWPFPHVCFKSSKWLGFVFKEEGKRALSVRLSSAYCARSRAECQEFMSYRSPFSPYSQCLERESLFFRDSIINASKVISRIHCSCTKKADFCLQTVRPINSAPPKKYDRISHSSHKQPNSAL